MKLTMLGILIFVTCAACSGEDLQIDLEKADTAAATTIQNEVDDSIDEQSQLARQKTAAKQNGFSAIALDKKKSSMTQSAKSMRGDKQLADKRSVNSVGHEFRVEKETPIDPELMRELEASLARVDDSKLLEHYDGKGSAVTLDLGGTKLNPGTIALNVSTQGLVSNVTSVSGATSIVGDPTGFGFTIGLSGDYLFEFDKDTLSPKAQAALKSVLTLYKDYEGTNIEVVGHTDSKGTNDYNLDLSKRRASSVKQWFQTAGISSSLIATKGLGETKPIAKNSINGKDNPEGRALNRRVEIVVKTKKKVNHLPTVSKSSSLSS